MANKPGNDDRNMATGGQRDASTDARQGGPQGTGNGTGNGSNYDYGFLVQAGYMINPTWEVFGRYDWTHLDNQASGSEDSFHEVAVGVNYYLHGHNAKFTIDAGWLPSGSPSSQTGIGVLANNGDNEFYIRGQFQLVL